MRSEAAATAHWVVTQPGASYWGTLGTAERKLCAELVARLRAGPRLRLGGRRLGRAARDGEIHQLAPLHVDPGCRQFD
jgi:hypothetical protein